MSVKSGLSNNSCRAVGSEEGAGGDPPIQILVDQLTLSQSGEADYAKDLWIYEQNTQIDKYIVGGTQKPF